MRILRGADMERSEEHLKDAIGQRVRRQGDGIPLEGFADADGTVAEGNAARAIDPLAEIMSPEEFAPVVAAQDEAIGTWLREQGW